MNNIRRLNNMEILHLNFTWDYIRAEERLVDGRKLDKNRERIEQDSREAKKTERNECREGTVKEGKQASK